jgi:superfamily II DNA or RNA helicase
MAENVEGEDYLSITQRITGDRLAHYAGMLTDTQRKFVQWTDQYSGREMAYVLRRKKNVREFTRLLTDEIIEREVRPYIERRLLHCFDALPGSNTRLFLQDTPDRIYPNREIFYDSQPSEAVFNFHYSRADGLRYFLSVLHAGKDISLRGKELIPLVGQPSVMLMDRLLLRFTDIDGKKLSPFTEKDYISVPRRIEETYFAGFVTDNIRKYHSQVKGFKVTDEPACPAAILSLEPDLGYRPALLLQFDYGNGRKPFTVAPTNTEASLHGNAEDGYEVKLFRRNCDAERQYAASLRENGFYEGNNGMFYADKTSSQGTGEGNLNALLEKLNALSDALHDNGFHIRQNFFPQKYYTGTIRLKTELKQVNDWFDVHATVHCNGFDIPFASFRRHILHRDRHYLLPDGTVMILPEEWLAKYAQAMLMSEEREGRLRLGKRYFALAGDVFEQPDDKYFHDMMLLCRASEIPPEAPPDRIRAVLRPYQMQGFAWMKTLHRHGLGGCLADDMGLGKTLQTICLLDWAMNEQPAAGSRQKTDVSRKPEAPRQGGRGEKYVQRSLFDPPESDGKPSAGSEERETAGDGERQTDGETPETETAGKRTDACLIVMPSSLVHNWSNEFARFAPHMKTLRYTGADRQEKSLDACRVALTTYGVLRNDLDALRRRRFRYVVLDEAQYIRNPESATFRAALQLNADHYLTLSGTPVENSLTDLWAQMNFLNRGLLGNLSFFREHFAVPIEKNRDEASRIRLQRMIRPFLLRRTKQEVTPELPELTEQTLYCEMNEPQRRLYEEEKSKARNEIFRIIGEGDAARTSMSVFRALSRLRQLAIHPAMLEAEYADGSGKFDRIAGILDNLHGEGHKALLFSSFTKHLDLIAARLDRERIPYAMLTGSTQRREEVIRRFNEDPGVPFFLISLKAGGVGLNLTAAGYVFLLDPWWNPAAERQAISRTHRIGQTEKVFAYRLISSETIEEKMLQLQEKKSALAGMFEQSAHPFAGMSAEDIMELFR